MTLSQPSGFTDPGGNRTMWLGCSGLRFVTYWVLAGAVGGLSTTETSANAGVVSNRRGTTERRGDTMRPPGWDGGRYRWSVATRDFGERRGVSRTIMSSSC